MVVYEIFQFSSVRISVHVTTKQNFLMDIIKLNIKLKLFMNQSEVSVLPAGCMNQSEVSVLPVGCMNQSEVSALPAGCMNQSEVSVLPAGCTREINQRQRKTYLHHVLVPVLLATKTAAPNTT